MATKVIHTTRTDGGWYQKPFADKPPLTEEQKLNKIKANAIREAVKATKTTTQTYDGVEFMMCEDCDLLEYADKLEAGTL